MIALKDMHHEDYDDVIDICKDIWGGTDYLPQIFHSWVDDKDGEFFAAVDTDKSKVIGLAKYTVLTDGTGWLEGIRVHKDYRGRKIAKLLSEGALEHANKDLQRGRVQKVAFATHVFNVESINMMKQYNFYLEQQHMIVMKDFDKLDPHIKKSDFKVSSWSITYEEFAKLPFTARRNGIFHIAFCFQKPTIEFFNYLKEHKSFVNINGYNGIYLFKGDPHFVTEEESFQAIDTFMNYYLLTLKGNYITVPLFSVMDKDKELIDNLKASGYRTMADWQNDYLYYVMK